MKVKALCTFMDIEAGVERHEGDLFTVSAKRADTLMNTKFGCLVEEVPEKAKAKKEAEED